MKICRAKILYIYICITITIYTYVYIYRVSDVDRITSRVQIEQVKPRRKVLYQHTRDDVNIGHPVYINSIFIE